MVQIPRKNLLAGFFCILVGICIVWRGFAYSIGTLSNIGPGFLPFLLGSILLICGVGISIQAARRTDAPFRINLRPYLAIPGAVIVFAGSMEFFGVLPAVALTTLAASLADPDSSLIGTAALALALMVLVYVVFILILRIPIQPFAWRL